MGHTYMLMDDNATAAESHRRAQAIFDKTLGPDHPDVARSLRAQAILLSNEGRYDEAIGKYERALAMFEEAPAPPREIANTRFSLGQAVWESGGDRKRAHELATRAAQEYRALGADEQITAMVAESWPEGHPAPE